MARIFDLEYLFRRFCIGRTFRVWCSHENLGISPICLLADSIAPVSLAKRNSYVSFSLLIYALFAMKNGSMSTDFWRLPFLLAIYLGFTISGVSKLFYPGWWDGEVIYALLTSHIVGPGWSADFVRQLPTRGIAYLTIAIEGLSLPLALWARTRKTAWWLNTFLHLGVLIIWRIGPVALGTLTVQLLIYPDKKLDEKK